MKRILSIIISGIILISGIGVYAEENVSEWAEDDFNKAKEIGIIPETLLNTDFTQEISRAEFSSLIVLTYEYLTQKEAPETTENPFSDTEDINVLKAYSLGIIKGVDKTRFAPDAGITREQAAVMLARLYKAVCVKGWNIDEDEKYPLEYDRLLVEVNDFSDKDEISDWAENSVYYLYYKEVIQGMEDGSFAPAAGITREQAAILALRLIDITGYEEKDEEDSDPREKFTVVFIGGSLTNGGHVWRNMVTDYLQEKYPDKNVVGINSGKGGTGSEYGCARFGEHVSKYKPDMIFIDCTINDNGSNEEGHKIYLESMLRQASKLSSDPSVVVLHFPYPADKTTDAYKQWYEGVVYKDQVCNHYGVKTINVYDYFYKEYLTQKSENDSLSFDTFISNYYPPDNVHPMSAGYEMFGKAIIEEFENDFEAMMSKVKKTGVYYTANKPVVTSSYVWTNVTDSRMHYSIDAWTVTSSDYFPEGMRQTYKAEAPALFGFDTTAEAFSLSYIASQYGSSATVEVDETVVGTLSCYSIYDGVNYKTNWIQLPNDGKVHRVIITVDRPTNSNYLFRFGAVIERYPGK